MLIGIRHGCDQKPERRGEDKESIKHDYSLCEDKKHAVHIQEKVQELISSYGFPKVILVSPLKRCRETGLLLQAELLRNARSQVPVLVDLRISRYFPDSPCIRDSTRKFDPPFDETMDEFRARNLKVVQSFRALNKRERQTVWLVTHALNLNIIREGLSLLDEDFGDTIKFLESFRFL